jgi:hypothetical protein
MLTDELLNYLFDGKSHPLAAPMEEWLSSSRRFTAFVSNNHTKIRKKLRTSQDSERVRDLQLELETAYLLLREKPLSVEYEPIHPREGRSPDFAVSFTTSLTFMVEVTRLRAVLAGVPFEDRFTDMLCSKLGQLLPQHSNVLVVGIETIPVTREDLRSIMIRLQQRAEANDPAVVQRHGFRDRADFIQRYQRLSTVLARGVPLQASEPVVLWNNPLGRYPLPARVWTALSRSHKL